LIKNIFILLIFLFSTLAAKEIHVTSLLTGLYMDHNRHLQAFTSDLAKETTIYTKQEPKQLKYDHQFMVKQVGKTNFRENLITNVLYVTQKNSKVFEFTIDSTTLSFMANLQNRNHSKDATVKLFDPNGDMVVNDPTHHVSVSDSAAATIIKIKAPIYGRWKMEFDLDSDFTGRVTGITPIKLYKFTFLETVIGREGLMYKEIKKPRTVVGSKSKIILFGEKLYDLESLKVRFVDINTQKSKEIKILGVYDDYNIYLEREVAFGKMFDVYVEGKDINGYAFTRKTKRPFSNY